VTHRRRSPSLTRSHAGGRAAGDPRSLHPRAPRSSRRQEATCTETWLRQTGARLMKSGVIQFFGADRPLLSITPREVLRYKIWLTDSRTAEAALFPGQHNASTSSKTAFEARPSGLAVGQRPGLIDTILRTIITAKSSVMSRHPGETTRNDHSMHAGWSCGVVSRRPIFRATMEQRSSSVVLKLSNCATYTTSCILPRRGSHEGRLAGFRTNFTVSFTQICARSR
jgi:hypothetical protein